MLKERYSFIALFTYEDDAISIAFPDLPTCHSSADKDDTNRALLNAKELLGLHLWDMEQSNKEIPEPSSINNLELKEKQIPVLIDVFMPPVRERLTNKFVKKTLSLPAWLAAKADEDGVNCSKIFQNALMEYLGVSSPTR